MHTKKKKNAIHRSVKKQFSRGNGFLFSQTEGLGIEKKRDGFMSLWVWGKRERERQKGKGRNKMTCQDMRGARQTQTDIKKCIFMRFREGIEDCFYQRKKYSRNEITWGILFFSLLCHQFPLSPLGHTRKREKMWDSTKEDPIDKTYLRFFILFSPCVCERFLCVTRCSDRYNDDVRSNGNAYEGNRSLLATAKISIGMISIFYPKSDKGCQQFLLQKIVEVSCISFSST